MLGGIDIDLTEPLSLIAEGDVQLFRPGRTASAPVFAFGAGWQALL